jgi:N,N'-diacetyllegionaminate synthase
MGKNQLKKKIEIIAEIANAHQGNPDWAKKLASESINSGADAIKFQIYFADELLSFGHYKFKHFKKQSFGQDVWINILKFFKEKKVRVYCDIFGEKAFRVAKICDVDGYKIHSSDLNNNILLNLVSETNKKIFLSSGGSTIEEISKSIRILQNKKIKLKPIILHGFQNYPTKLNNCDLFKIRQYIKLFGKICDLGYQDHLAGENHLNYKTPILAACFGARYLEKHITLDRSKKGIDYYSSLEPQEFKTFVQGVRDFEINKKNITQLGMTKKQLSLAIGNGNIENISVDESNYRKNVKKVWFLKKKVLSGNKIKKNNLIMKRPEEINKNNIDWDYFINKKTIKNINKNIIIDKSMFVNDITATIIARTNSKRLKNKVIKKICGIFSIEHLINKIKQSKKINRIILCTTKKKEDDILVKIAKNNKINYYRGSEKNVLERILGSIKKYKTDAVIRLTGDDILIDTYYLDKTIDYHLKNNLQYTDAKNLPSGIEAEVFDRQFLETIYKIAEDSTGTEYLTYYVSDHKSQFKIGSLDVNNDYRKKIRLTLDNKEDFIVISKFLENMKKRKKLFTYTYDDIISFYKNNKKIFLQNLDNTEIKKKVNTRFIWKRLFF